MRILRTSVLVIFVIVLALFSIFKLQQRSADKTYPVITIEGDMLNVSIAATDEVLLQGVSAYDEKDGDLTHKLIVESVSRFVKTGVCVVNYVVCDSDHHTASASRWITYTDYEHPRFTLSDSLVFGLSENVNIRSRLGAMDSIDGNISNKVIITANEYSSNVAGVSYISAKVTNSKGDSITLELPVYMEELSLSAPKIRLKEYLAYRKVGEEFDIMANVTECLDQREEDLTAFLITDTNLDLSQPGVYEVHYQVTDSGERKGHSIATVIVEE